MVLKSKKKFLEKKFKKYQMNDKSRLKNMLIIRQCSSVMEQDNKGQN